MTFLRRDLLAEMRQKVVLLCPDGHAVPDVDVRDYDRGFARIDNRTIVLPLWLINHSADYRRYYLAHELAHFVIYDLYNGDRKMAKSHGQQFQGVLHNIAPDVHHFEDSYKPRCYRAFIRRQQT